MNKFKGISLSVLTGALFATHAIANVDFTIDFELDGDGNALNAGDFIYKTVSGASTPNPLKNYDNFFAPGEGVHFSSTPGVSPGLIIFDTASPTGGDNDLRTPGGATSDGNTQADWDSGNYVFGDSNGAGNVLIIQEEGHSNPQVPDDRVGGTINIRFDREITLKKLGFVDIEQSEFEITSTNLLFDSFNGAGNNSYTERDYNWENVTEIEIRFSGSGALSGIQFTAVPEPATVSVIVLGLGLISYLGFRRRKQMA